ncbi:unnamed protein product, partial [Adineta steineri]
MASRRICLWIIFVIITQSVGEDTRSVIMSLITGSKFQCVNTTCLPFANVITSIIMKCQMACLAQIYCRAASFHQSTSNCELFTDMSNEIAHMASDIDITTMIVIAETRSPPEPTTTASTISLLSTSSSIITTTTSASVSSLTATTSTTTSPTSTTTSSSTTTTSTTTTTTSTTTTTTSSTTTSTTSSTTTTSTTSTTTSTTT